MIFHHDIIDYINDILSMINNKQLLLRYYCIAILFPCDIISYDIISLQYYFLRCYAGDILLAIFLPWIILLSFKYTQLENAISIMLINTVLI